MIVVSYLSLGVLFVLLLVFFAIDLHGQKLSFFEMNRLAKLGNKKAQHDLRRGKLLKNLLSLKIVTILVLIVVWTTISTVSFGWLIGLSLTLVTVILLIQISHLKIIQKFAKKIYGLLENKAMDLIDNKPIVAKLTRLVLPEQTDNTINSREELLHMIDTAKSVLSAGDRKLIATTLNLDKINITEVMVPREKIDHIDQRELLGPLVLNDLHKAGSQLLLVIDGNIDHIVGLLDIGDQLVIDGQSETKIVSEVMNKAIIIGSSQLTVKEALAQLINSRAQAIVVTQDGNTEGIVYFIDIINLLLGDE